MTALEGRCISSSFGVTEVQSGDTPETMLRRADRALYQAKSNGRNTVVQLGSGIGNADGTPKRRGWLAWLRPAPPEMVLEKTLATSVPFNVVVEKMRGFVSDHHATIDAVTENYLVLKIEGGSTPGARRATDRAVPFIIEMRFDESSAQSQVRATKLIRTIMTSHAYGLSALPKDRNSADTRNYSRHYRQRLRAETLLDAVTDITEVPETFTALPPRGRAMELWTVRTQSVFLDSFGRPDPNQDPPCERTSDTTVVQVLQLMNSPNLHRKVTADGSRAARLAASTKTPREIVDELYLLVYSRLPTEDERTVCLRVFAEKDATRRQAAEDLMWALINTPEFVFKN